MSTGTEGLAAILAEVGRRLPPVYLRAWCAVLREQAGPTPDLERRLLAARAGNGLGPLAAMLVGGWRSAPPGLPGAAVALGLETAVAQYEHRRATGGTEVVVSGPAGPAVAVRLTSSVAIDVIAGARRSLLLVSFAAYGVHDVVEALREAVTRGVHVDLILEGRTSARRAFAGLGAGVRLWEWPRHRRPEGAALHAKLVAADSEVMLLGSANLTDRAFGDNLELGLILRDREVVGRVFDHFSSLMRPGVGPLEPLVG